MLVYCTSKFARLARCRVVSIDYRLAPEHQFPAAIEDSVCAYRALLAEGHKASNIAIGGESAGGGLAVATLVAARDRRLSMPAALIALSPWTDMRCESESFRTKADVDPLLTRRSLKEMADAYLGGADPLDGRASPAMAKLVGLPPMLVHVGSEEVLLDDSWALVKVAKAANVQARLEVWPEMIHVWHMFHPMLPEGAQAIEALAGFVLEKWKKAEMREQSVQQN